MAGKKIWSDYELQVLTDTWRQNVSKLKSMKRNSSVYHKMADHISSVLFLPISGEDVQSKIMNLTKQYRREKGKLAEAGTYPSIWRHYEAVHSILGVPHPESNESVDGIPVKAEVPVSGVGRSNSQPGTSGPELHQSESRATSGVSEEDEINAISFLTCDIAEQMGFPSPTESITSEMGPKKKRKKKCTNMLAIENKKMRLLEQLADQDRYYKSEIVRALREKNKMLRHHVEGTKAFQARVLKILEAKNS